MSVIICCPSTFLIRRIASCPNCKCRRRFVGSDQLWYGVTWFCCGCGDRWTEGERHVRPFARGWRAKAIAEARRKWDAAGPHDKAAHHAWLKAEMTGGDGGTPNAQ